MARQRIPRDVLMRGDYPTTYFLSLAHFPQGHDVETNSSSRQHLLTEISIASLTRWLRNRNEKVFLQTLRCRC